MVFARVANTGQFKISQTIKTTGRLVRSQHYACN